MKIETVLFDLFFCFYLDLKLNRIRLNQYGSTAVDVDSIDWEMRLNMDLTRRSDSNQINNSPITLVPPVFIVRLGSVQRIPILTYDRDGDEVRCRWSELQKNECGGK